MAIYEGSRYENAIVVRTTDFRGNSFPTIYADVADEEQFFQFDYVVIREGDRLDHLAFRYYNDSELWWVIARANPDIYYPENIPPGTTIRVPHADSIF